MKRKLAIIDAQLSGPSLFHRLIGTAPLFFAAVGLMVGIVLGQPLASASEAIGPRRWLTFWAVCAGLLCIAVVVYAIREKRPKQPVVFAWAAGLVFMCLGAARLAAFTVIPANDIRRFVGAEQTLATLRGRILTPPYQQVDDWYFAQLAFSDPATTFYLEVTQAQTADGWKRICGTIRVHVDGPVLDLRAGDCIEFDCWLYEFDGPTNPGQFDVAEYLARRNIFVGAAVASRDAITPHEARRQGLIARVRSRLSQIASQAALGDAPADSPAQGLLAALLLGDRRHIDRDTYEAFRKTGLLHFVSLSGLHMGIFVWVIWWVGKVAGLTKPYRALMCLAATVAFLLVVPPRAPTVRAALVVWLYCLALLVRRRTNPLNSLCLAAIILLLIRPTQLFEAGWQLSFAAVAGILAFSERTHRCLRLPGHAGRLVSTGIAAWIGGAGILLHHFFAIAPLTALWTVLVFPLVALILIAGFAKAAFFFLLPTVSALLGALVSTTAGVLIHIVKLLAELDASTVLVGHVTVWVALAYYGLVLFAGFALMRRPLWKRRIAVTWAVLLVAYLGGLKWQRTHPETVQLTTLDVGHGQAIVAQFPDGKAILFDAGSLYTPDVGGRIVVPFLDYAGIGRLDAVFISHGDIDHINGIPEVVAARRVGHIYAHRDLPAESQSQDTVGLLVEFLAQQGFEIEPAPPTTQAGRASINVIWPAEETALPTDLSDNDRSLVFLIRTDAADALLCSDIEQYAQKQITRDPLGLQANVVVCPHHGSRTTLAAGFIEELAPAILVCSGSRTDYDRSRETLTALPGKLAHTAKNGAITVCLGASDVLEADGLTVFYQGE